MLKLDDETKIIEKLLVIKEICSWPASWVGWTESLQPRTYFFNH